MRNSRNIETAVARGISGRAFTQAEISSTLESSADDIMTLYRGTSGSEGTGVLFLTEDAEYAAAYAAKNGTQVATYQVSRSGFNKLKNEGLINVGKNNGVLVGADGKTVATGGEVSVSNQAIKTSILEAKIP